MESSLPQNSGIKALLVLIHTYLQNGLVRYRSARIIVEEADVTKVGLKQNMK